MSFAVNVDATNPGQFFACCGLLELADRLCPGAEGWFDGESFRVEGAAVLQDLLSILVMDPPTALERFDNGLEVQPILAPLTFTFDGGSTVAITLDYWTRVGVLKGAPQVISNSPWNFWSGQQTSLRIWSGLRAELAAQLRQLAAADHWALLTRRLFQKGRFGFDPGPAWNALDVGFSPNEQGMEVESSPATELLAAVGLQRFRPVLNESRDGFDYFTWHFPCSPAVAAAAMAGAVRDGRSVRYRCSVVSRGQYAALSASYPVRKGADDE